MSSSKMSHTNKEEKKLGNLSINNMSQLQLTYGYYTFRNIHISSFICVTGNQNLLSEWDRLNIFSSPTQTRNLNNRSTRIVDSIGRIVDLGYPCTFHNCPCFIKTLIHILYVE